MRKILFTVVFLLISGAMYAQGDYTLQKKGNVTVSWRLVSDFQRAGASCWGWTYHIFISNANNFPVTIKSNQAYQNMGDNSSCWQDGSVDINNQVIPAGKWKEYTFRVSSAPSGKPGTPGLKYNLDWSTDYTERKID